MPPKQSVKRKAANGYKMPEAIHPGEILTDLSKKQWKLGPSIGKGGFGEIYSAQDASSPSKDFKYVIKIEPHSNGPLFVETHFYIKFGKPDMVEAFRKKKNLKTFGMPIFHGSGSHTYKDEKYRFLVLDRYGTDLYKIYLDNNKQLDSGTVFKLGVQMLDVLEYIHENEYVHADIKGANILFGLSKETRNQAYLVDFGLACKFTTDKQFKPNPKKAHDGTIEYLSRDAHKGVPTRRGDLEILAYNLIHWLGCTLPWEKKLSDPDVVHTSKTEFMTDIPKFMKNCFGSQQPPSAIVKLLEYVNSLPHDSEPDYDKIRKLFINEIKSSGDSSDKPFTFNKTAANRRSSLKRKSSTRLSFNTKTINKIVKKKAVVKKSKVKAVTETSEKKADSHGSISSNSLNGLTPQMRAIMEKKMLKTKGKKVEITKPTKPKPSTSKKRTSDEVKENDEIKNIRRKMESGVKDSKNDRPARNIAPVSYTDVTPAPLRKLFKKS